MYIMLLGKGKPTLQIDTAKVQPLYSQMAVIRYELQSLTVHSQ